MIPLSNEIMINVELFITLITILFYIDISLPFLRVVVHLIIVICTQSNLRQCLLRQQTLIRVIERGIIINNHTVKLSVTALVTDRCV